MSYISGSGQDKTTASGFDIQGPKPLPASAFGQAKGNISSSVVLEPPSQVILNGIGNYTFKYDCSDAVGSAVLLANFSSANVVQIIEDDMSLTLPINPCAVSSSGNASGTTTNVTFVYRGGL